MPRNMMTAAYNQKNNTVLQNIRIISLLSDTDEAEKRNRLHETASDAARSRRRLNHGAS